MKIRTEITPDELEYVLRMLMDILGNMPKNKVRILK